MERNWKYSRIGEIDIIAKEKDTIVFVEVKYRRTNTFGTAIEAITKSKLDKIYKSALAYLNEKKLLHTKFRIDVIAIDKDKLPEIEHIRNVGFS